MSSILNSKTIDGKHINNKNLNEDEEFSKPKKTTNNIPNKESILSYKGIHFKQEKQLKLYEHGAHFKYQELYNILNSLVGKQEMEIGSTSHSSVGNLHSLIDKGENKNENMSKMDHRSNKSLKDDNNNENDLYKNNKFTKENKTFVNNHKYERDVNNVDRTNNKTQLMNKKSKTLDRNMELIDGNKNKLDPIKNNILPPINKKIENLEFVKSKIDTGIKGSAIKKVGKFVL